MAAAKIDKNEAMIEGYELREEGKWTLNHPEYPLQITPIDGRGRCVIATKDYSRGDVILKEQPYAMIIHHYLQSTCAYCGRTPNSGQIYGISPDDPQRYCSQKCLSNDSKIHRTEEKALKLLRELGVDGGIDPCSLLVRIAAQRKIENSTQQLQLQKFPLLGQSNTFSHIMSLEAASSSLGDESIRDIQRVAAAMSELITSCNLEMSVDEAYQLLLIIQCNAHRIKDGKNDVALGLFPLTSMLNHSCSPNCFHSYVIDSTDEHAPPTLVIRALSDIKCGDEICYNYIPLYQSTDIRQGQLYRAYSFTCMCPRCQYNTTNTLDNTSEDSYPLDHVISLPTETNTTGISPFESSTEVLTCHSLLTRSIDTNNRSAINSIIKKLTTLCATEKKISIFHPSNEILLTTYETISRGCEFLLHGKSSLRYDYERQEITLENNTLPSLIEEQRHCMTAIGFSYLALGSILKFTKIRNNEVGELEEFIGLCLYRLNEVSKKLRDQFLSNSAEGDATPAAASTVAVTATVPSDTAVENNEKIIQLFQQAVSGDSFSNGEFLDIMTVLVLFCLKSCRYYWETDPRVTDLIYIASKYPFQCYQQDRQPLYEPFILSSRRSKFHEVSK